MHLRSHLLPRQSASSPLDNITSHMAGASQALNLEGIYHEMHDIAEHIRIMNELNARLVQHLAANNPTPITVSLSILLNRVILVLLEVAKMPTTCTLHKSVTVSLPAITSSMTDEGKAFRYLNHDLPIVERRGQEVNKFTGEEDCPSHIIIPPCTAVTP